MKKVSGSPLPLGVTYKNGRANFAMEVPEGKTCKLLLYRKGEASLLASYVFSDRIGSVCYMAVDGLKEEAYEYNYDIDGESVTDSYAKALSGKKIWLKNIGISEKSKENVRGIFYEDHGRRISHHGYRKKNGLPMQYMSVDLQKILIQK